MPNTKRGNSKNNFWSSREFWVWGIAILVIAVLIIVGILCVTGVLNKTDYSNNNSGKKIIKKYHEKRQFLNKSPVLKEISFSAAGGRSAVLEWEFDRPPDPRNWPSFELQQAR